MFLEAISLAGIIQKFDPFLAGACVVLLFFLSWFVFSRQKRIELLNDAGQ